MSGIESAAFRHPDSVDAHTFHFINDGPERALDLARSAAGGRDVRISGGAEVIQQYLNMGAVEELEIALVPVLFGGGRRLFENVRDGVAQFRVDRVLDSPAATHPRYVRVYGASRVARADI